MWIEKLANGVLEIDTPIGPRYLQPNLLERVYLLWTFRNFPSLPQQVLSSWQQRLVERLRSDRRFVSVSSLDGPSQPVIGKIERRVMPQDPVLPKKSAAATAAGVAEPGREVVSA